MAAKLFVTLALVAAHGRAEPEGVNPVQKVIELLSTLEAKLLKEGDAEEKAYKEFVAWCDDAARNKRFEIKTATAQKEKLEATISKAVSVAEENTASIGDLAASIATDEADLKAATEIRDKEFADFSASEAELMDGIDTLARAIGILEKNAKGSALMQTSLDTKNVKALLQTLSAMIDSVATFSGHDKQKLLAMVQNGQADDDDDSDLGAPAPDAYKSHSSSVIDVLEDMKDKAEAQLSEARKAEMNAKHNYELLKQSLTDQIAASNHEKTEAETAKSEAEGTKAAAEGDLAQTVKDLADAQDALATVGSDCMTSASDHEASMNSRKEELTVLAKAKKIIQSTSGGAESQSYSFLQVRSSGSSVSGLHTEADLRNFEVVNAIKRLASQQHSTELAQLAARVSAAYRYSAASGEDPFAKVKELITQMIDRLMKEAGEEASFKAYCDEEMAKTKQKQDELTYDISKLTGKIDQAASRSADLKAQVAELQKELADLAKTTAEMDKTRADEKAVYVEAKADLEQGLSGIQGALKILRDYYEASDGEFLQDSGDLGAFMQQPAKPVAHEKASGAGGSIIGMLEVIESDFSKSLAEKETTESSAQSQYEKQTQQNKITKTLKEQDVKYKTQEFKGLDKTLAELSSDREGMQTELDAVLEYNSQIRAQCIAKPETYEERKKRREAEIAGLKEALSILEGEAVFLQQPHRHGGLRGVAPHARA